MQVFIWNSKRAGEKLPECWCCPRKMPHSQSVRQSLQKSKKVRTNSSLNSPGPKGSAEDDDSDDEEEKLEANAQAGGSSASPEAPIDWHDSLLFAPKLPTSLRIMVLVVLVINIALFLWSNNSVGAGVGAIVGLAGQQLDLNGLFDFTLSNSVHDMWTAGAYPLSIIIALFSGAWPYIKLLMMIGAWVLPKQVMSLSTREQFLMFLDRWGKWSLIDTFVLVLMMVAFRLHIGVLNNDLDIDVLVDPDLGFQLFLVATMMSLGLSHLLLAFHRHDATNFVIRPGGPVESLQAHAYKVFAVQYVEGHYAPVPLEENEEVHIVTKATAAKLSTEVPGTPAGAGKTAYQSLPSTANDDDEFRLTYLGHDYQAVLPDQVCSCFSLAQARIIIVSYVFEIFLNNMFSVCQDSPCAFNAPRQVG
jgi:hypothetical protein